MGDSFPYDCTFGALIVRFLSIAKKFFLKKKVGIKLEFSNVEAGCTTTIAHWTLNYYKRNIEFITNCVWAAVYRNVAEDSARNRLHQSNVDSERQ